MKVCLFFGTFDPLHIGHDQIASYFLENYFEQYVEYSFTAELEKKLDLVSEGKLDWRKLLEEFWENFKFILKNAVSIGIYEPKDYKKKPQKYCGMTITDNPYYDL